MRGIIAVLALEAGAVVAPSRLLDTLWEETAGASTNALQVAISKLRRALADAGEPDRVVTYPAGYQLAVAPGSVDALQFEQLIRDASAPGIAPATAAEHLRRALQLWRGPALATHRIPLGSGRSASGWTSSDAPRRKTWLMPTWCRAGTG